MGGPADAERDRGEMPEHGHEPVLMAEVLELLAPTSGELAVDCTTGRGGHAGRLLAATGRLVGLDADPRNLGFARDRLPGAELHHANFADLPTVLGDRRADVLLADLGVSTNQLLDPAYGLGIAGDGPLDMRLDPALPRTAADLVNTLPEKELADLICGLADERHSRRIARRVVEARPLRTTAELRDVVRRAVPGPRHRRRIDPATRTFQALRMAVNGESRVLDALLDALPEVVAPGGRVAIISFHSGEDRPVKRRLLGLAQGGGWERLTRKPVTASDAELAANPRSRSAKLRAIRRDG